MSINMGKMLGSVIRVDNLDQGSVKMYYDNGDGNKYSLLVESTPSNALATTIGEPEYSVYVEEEFLLVTKLFEYELLDFLATWGVPGMVWDREVARGDLSSGIKVRHFLIIKA